MIPVYINTFNRLTTTRNLVDQVTQLDNAQPVVIDNCSTYEPLLDWYESNPCDVVRLRENIGHHAPWLSGVISGDRATQYVVTDCDLDLAGVPVELLSVLASAFDWRVRTPVKSGVALRIDDLPHWQSGVVTWESRWWKYPVSHDRRFYWAAIDTTFAMYKSTSPHHECMNVVGSTAVRLGGEYQARHVPWYLDCENLDDENRNYFETASASNSWKPRGKSLDSVWTGEKRHAPRRV